MPRPCWRVAESGCGRERLQSSAVRTGGLTSVSCVFAVLDGAWQRVSRLTVVPRGLHLRYLCADRFDTASTTRGISTTLLRISGADEHRYARYGRASTTDTADTHSERMVSRCIKTAPEGYRTNEKARRSGPSVQGLMSRISSQHHRCNGKSFQCPSNVTTFRGYTLLWASALLSFPCTCYYAPILAARNPISHLRRYCSFICASVRRHIQTRQSCGFVCASNRFACAIMCAPKDTPVAPFRQPFPQPTISAQISTRTHIPPRH